MKIVPNSDILIEGKHSPAGVVTETGEALAKALISQGLVKAAPADAEKPIETAARKPAAGGKAAPVAKPAPDAK